jgi:hypothetical protein
MDSSNPGFAPAKNRMNNEVIERLLSNSDHPLNSNAPKGSGFSVLPIPARERQLRSREQRRKAFGCGFDPEEFHLREIGATKGVLEAFLNQGKISRIMKTTEVKPEQGEFRKQAG